MRTTPSQPDMGAWCTGSAGIGLARVKMLGIAGGPELLADVDIALRVLGTASATTSDHICCGTAGQIEFLVTAGTELDRSALIANGRTMAEDLDERTRDGTPNCECGAYGGLDTSFMRGGPGLTWAIERARKPNMLPCVLAVDPPQQ